MVHWKTIITSPQPSAAEYQLYLKRFGENALFADLARVRVEELGAFAKGAVKRVGKSTEEAKLQAAIKMPSIEHEDPAVFWNMIIKMAPTSAALYNF